MLVSTRRHGDDVPVPILTTLSSVGLDLTNSSGLQSRQTRRSGLQHSFEWNVDNRCDILHKLERAGIMHQVLHSYTDI